MVGAECIAAAVAIPALWVTMLYMLDGMLKSNFNNSVLALLTFHFYPSHFGHVECMSCMRRKIVCCAGTKYKFAKLWKDYAAFGNIEEV